jgi:integrase
MKLPKGIQIRGNSYVAYVTSPAGKAVRKAIAVVGCATPKELVRLRGDFEKTVREGLYPSAVPTESAPETPAITCADLWEAYKKDCLTRDVRRVDRLKLAWSHLEPVFGAKPAATVRPKDIAEYVAMRRASQMAAATCNREVAILKASFRLGARLELVQGVPMFPKKLKEAKPRKGFVEDGQYSLLAKNAGELWLRTFVALGFNFGWRKSEILGLRVRNVDLLESWLEIEDSKNGEGRKVKLTHELETLLAECIRGKCAEDFLLTHRDGSRVAQPRKDWYAVCCRCGLGKLDEKGRYSGLQMHDLRRSAIRRMVRRGVPEKVAMMISGHKTRSVFERYNIGNERDLEDAAKLLEPGRQVSFSEVENRHKTDTLGFGHS